MSAIPVSDHLLPPGATVPEKAAASLGVLVDRLHDPIGAMADADTIPAQALPHLAWGVSADAYDPAWPELRRRKVVGEWVLYHERKTTVAGVRMALGYRDVELVDHHLPRHGIYCDVAVALADQARWLAGLPEIRIYDPSPVLRPGVRPAFVGAGLVCDPDARLSRRAVLARDGVETPLTIAPRDGMERIVLPVRAIAGLVFGGPAASRVVAPSEIRETVLVVRPIASGDDDYVRPVAAAGDVGTLVTARRLTVPNGFPIFAPVGHHRPAGVPLANMVAPVSVARSVLVMRLTGAPGRQTGHKALNCVGASRITPPPYSAGWTVHVARAVPRLHLPEGRLVAPSSAPRVREVEEAVRSASALRDYPGNRLNLSATRRLTFADLRAVRAGQRFGDRKRIFSHV